MITLHIAQLLADEGFGTLDTDIFWEDAPLDAQGNPKNGITVVSRGNSYGRFIKTQAFDIYARYTNKITSSLKLEAILDYLQQAYGEVCELPEVPNHSQIRYYDCLLIPTSSVETVGADEQDKIVRVISGEIKYKKEEN